MDKHILGSLKRLFLQRNKEILCSKSPDAYNSCSNATTVHQFIKSHHTFAGSSSLADYYAENNPIDWIPKVSLVLQTIGQIMTMLSGENTNTAHQQRGWSRLPGGEHPRGHREVRDQISPAQRPHCIEIFSSRSQPGAVLLRTPRGSHISFNEGLLGTRCYLSRVTMDFLDSAKHIIISTS